MNILIDTHILLWFQANPDKLSYKLRSIIEDPNHSIWISQTSIFEIAIKRKLNKLPDFTISIDELIQQTIQDNIKILPISNAHIAAYERIPLFDEHRDPFDRLILATALAENWSVISADEKFRLYDGVVQLIW